MLLLHRSSSWPLLWLKGPVILILHFLRLRLPHLVPLLPRLLHLRLLLTAATQQPKPNHIDSYFPSIWVSSVLFLMSRPDVATQLSVEKPWRSYDLPVAKKVFLTATCQPSSPNTSSKSKKMPSVVAVLLVVLMASTAISNKILTLLPLLLRALLLLLLIQTTRRQWCLYLFTFLFQFLSRLLLFPVQSLWMRATAWLASCSPSNNIPCRRCQQRWGSPSLPHSRPSTYLRYLLLQQHHHLLLHHLQHVQHHQCH